MQNFPNSLQTPDSISPKVGMGATICFRSDREPFKVVRVSKSGKSCWVKPVASWIISGTAHDGSAEYGYGEVNENCNETKVSKTDSGWKAKGGGNVWLGRMEKHRNPHF